MDHPVEIKESAHVAPTNKNFFALLALFIIPISGLSIDIYVPSLPAMSDYFAVDKALVQLSITAYMIGLGVMQFFAGGICDSFGRKQPFLIATFINIIVTLLIPNVQNIEQLLFLRFIQGIVVALMMVPMRSVISDLFEGPTYYKMATYMTLAWSIGPIVAPVIGGYLQDYIGWQANFYLLAIYCALSFTFNMLYLPETTPFRHPFHVTKILIRYKEILLNRNYVDGLFISGLLYSVIILFTIVGPFYIQTVLHYSAVEFGYVTLLAGLAWFIGGVINRLLINVRLEKKVAICCLTMLAIAVISLFVELIVPMQIYFLLPVILLTLISGIVFPNYFAQAMALFPQSAGSANALLGGFLYLFTGICSGLGTFLKSTSIQPLLFAYIALISLCLMIRYMSYGKKSRE